MRIFDEMKSELKRMTQPGIDEDDYEDDFGQPPPPAPRSERRERRPTRDFGSAFGGDTEDEGRKNNVLNIRANTQVKVVVASPRQYEEVESIANHLCEKRTVVINLENTADDVSRRVLDFLSGVAYANDGRVRRVADKAYMVTPFNVDILGDIIDELENKGLYF